MNDIVFVAFMIGYHGMLLFFKFGPAADFEEEHHKNHRSLKELLFLGRMRLSSPGNLAGKFAPLMALLTE